MNIWNRTLILLASFAALSFTAALTTSCGEKDDPEAALNNNKTAEKDSAKTSTASTNAPAAAATTTASATTAAAATTAASATAATNTTAPQSQILAGTAWAWVTDPRFTLTFTDATNFSGNLNCKSYRGNYQSDQNGNISFPTPIQTSAQICADSAPNSTTVFADTLSLTKTYTVGQDVLTLNAGDATTRFIRQ